LVNPPVTPIWVPSATRRTASNLWRWCEERGFEGYDEAWAWSVAPPSAGEFWRGISDYCGARWHRPPVAALEPAAERVSGYRWFRDGQLNYAERALQAPPGGPQSLAVVARSQARPASELTWADLSDLVARVRSGLVEAGIDAGERVAGYLPNIPEALAAMLACASVGAIWTACAPEMGVTGVVERLSQIGPAAFISVDGYRYGARAVDRRAEAEAIRARLPTVRTAVWLRYLEAEKAAPYGWQDWDQFVAVRGPLEFASVDFEHPLYILFSSGTTGKPKAILHSHGGILLEHAKTLRLHFDLGPGDRFFWFSTTGWMMWNFCVSGLLAGATVVLFDGDPNWPAAGHLWELFESTGTTCAGVGASYLVANMRAGLGPGTDFDLRSLKTIGSTGSPLPAAAAEWVYQAVADDVLLASFSGGTDVCTGFVGASPLHPVWAGEISCRCLGAKVEVFDDDGHPVVGQEGELVLSGPLPSMPVGFWADDGSRYRSAYFSRFPGVWAHGDRAILTGRGTVVITGRSDGTLNRGGVRIGTAEFYAVVEALPEVADSLVVHIEDPTGGPGDVWLFVVEGQAATAPEDLQQKIRAALRGELSPRYVPDRIITVPAIPRTLSGKKLEVPIKRLLSGVALSDALALTSVADPDNLEPFVALSAQGVSRGAGRAAGR
jgi:acetoacetyl-CoA synthetase